MGKVKVLGKKTKIKKGGKKKMAEVRTVAKPTAPVVELTLEKRLEKILGLTGDKYGKIPGLGKLKDELEPVVTAQLEKAKRMAETNKTKIESLKSDIAGNKSDIKNNNEEIEGLKKENTGWKNEIETYKTEIKKLSGETIDTPELKVYNKVIQEMQAIIPEAKFSQKKNGKVRNGNGKYSPSITDADLIDGAQFKYHINDPKEEWMTFRKGKTDNKDRYSYKGIEHQYIGGSSKAYAIEHGLCTTVAGRNVWKPV